MLICILGNSHAGALKSAWDAMQSERSDVELHFFAMRGQHMRFARVNGDRLEIPNPDDLLRTYPETVGNSVEIRRYDAFILHGLGLHPLLPERTEGVSRACYDCVISDSITNTANWSILSELRRVTKAPVAVGTSPLTAAVEVRSRNVHPIVDQDAALLEARLAEMNAVLVRQPNSTIVNGTKTDPIYNEGALGIAPDATKVDFENLLSDRKYMNSKYGRVMLQLYLDRLTSLR